MGEAWRRVVASGAVDNPSLRCSDPPPAGLIESIRLFNDDQYYECHEALEALWHAEREPIRYLYQGILQIGVGFHHWRRDNFRGAHLLLTDGIDKVLHFTPTCMAIDTAQLREQAQHCLDLLHALGRERMGEFDWSTVPHISIATADT
jgi:hypothetical protein